MSIKYNYAKVEAPIESVVIKTDTDKTWVGNIELNVVDAPKPYVVVVRVTGDGGTEEYYLETSALVELNEAIVTILGEL
jgi:hypothetical protein